MKGNLKRYSDMELISMMSESKQQESAIFSELYDRYESMLRAYVITIVKEEATTEDIVQETFIRFYKTIKKGNDFPNVPGFLITVARNECLNRKRLNKQVVPLSDNDASNAVNIGYESKELLELVIMSTEFLKDKYRRAFMLREFDGLKYQEIAKLENIAVPTAKIRVMRARQMVIKTLQPYIDDLSK
jgi:RNA polymerase sigma-70 factor (ECF subfamily)